MHKSYVNCDRNEKCLHSFKFSCFLFCISVLIIDNYRHAINGINDMIQIQFCTIIKRPKYIARSIFEHI